VFLSQVHPSLLASYSLIQDESAPYISVACKLKPRWRKMKEIDVQWQSLFIVFVRAVGQEAARSVPKFPILRQYHNCMNWKLDYSVTIGENSTKTVYNLYSYWTSSPPSWLHFSHRPNDWSSWSKYIYDKTSVKSNRPFPLWVKFWSRYAWTKISSQLERASQN
jgi:hypothetical protein